jgi:hypothetical protein
MVRRGLTVAVVATRSRARSIAAVEFSAYKSQSLFNRVIENLGSLNSKPPLQNLASPSEKHPKSHQGSLEQPNVNMRPPTLLKFQLSQVALDAPISFKVWRITAG